MEHTRIRYHQIFFISLFSFVFNTLNAQMYFEDAWEPEIVIQHDTIMVHDTLYVSNLDDVTRIFKMTFQDFAKQLLQGVAAEDSIELSTLEQIYLNYMLPMYFPTFLNHRYIYRNYNVERANENVVLHEEVLSPPLSSFIDSLQLDVLLTSRGEIHTDYFLKSPILRSSCLEQLFVSIHQSYQGKIKGVNLYFPDFSFKQKRAMAQFVKSASLVIDSCKINTIRDLRLYISFDKETGNKHLPFLYSLTHMVDSVFLVDSHTPHWTIQDMNILTTADAKKSSWWNRMTDQFYLARFYIKPFPETSEDELTITDLRKLIFADYPDAPWEVYCFVLLTIFLLVIIFFILFRFVPAVSYFVYHHLPLISGLLFMLVFEVYILFICMVENMSNDNIFTLEGENINAILYLPLVFIFIFPMLSNLNKRRERP